MANVEIITNAMRGMLYPVWGHVRAFKSRPAVTGSPHSKCRASRSRRVVLVLVLFAVAPLSICGAAKNRSAMQLPGYKAVRVHYGPMNKMIMSASTASQPICWSTPGRTN